MISVPRIGIFGAGPAGLSAALWLQNLGLQPLVVENQAICGGMQNLNFLANDWVLGQPGVTGPELARRFCDHAEKVAIKVCTNTKPVRVSRTAAAFEVRFQQASGDVFEDTFTALLIATGTRFRGEEILAAVRGSEMLPAERVAFGPYAFQALDQIAGERVLVIGGGDNAFENARLIAQSASVHLVMRSKPRAQTALYNAVRAAVAEGRCQLHFPAKVAEFKVLGGCIEAILDDGVRLQVDRVHVLAGYEPNTKFLRDACNGLAFDFDNQDYLRVDDAGRTGVAGVYAAGDICNPAFPSVLSALSQGARAAKTIEMDLRTL